MLGQPLQHTAHQHLRHRSTRGDADRGHSLEPRRIDVLGVVDQVGRPRPRIQGDLHQPHRVRRVTRTDDNHQLAFRGHRLHRDLAVLGGVADVVTGRVLQRRKALTQALHRLHGLVDAQRRLGQPNDLVLVTHRDVVHRVGAVDQLYVVGRLTGGADDFLMAFVADEQNVEVVTREALGFLVHLGDQRAGGVDGLQIAFGGLLVDRRRHPVGREDHDGALGHLIGLVDENGAGLGQRVHHIAVMHDLVTHVDGGAVLLQGTLHRFDGTVHTRAVAARLSQQHALAGRRADCAHRGAHHPRSAHIDCSHSYQLTAQPFAARPT
ncbi:Uncharacterised protein [Mycobacteroides abscessus subsp. abscessus]|nr:Uncharacterised protein [Mycobacteroides abscessus subsp. abscessus]